MNNKLLMFALVGAVAFVAYEVYVQQKQTAALATQVQQNQNTALPGTMFASLYNALFA